MAGLELHNFQFVYNLPSYPESVQYGLHLTKANLWDYWGAVFLQSGCYSCSPTNSVKVLNSKIRIGECYLSYGLKYLRVISV